MRVYFDKKNIESFIASSNHSEFQDCLRMIKSQCDIYFTFPKEILAKPPYNLFLNLLSSGRSLSSLRPQFIDLFPPRPLKSNIHKDFNRDELTAVYLLDDDKIETVKRSGNILIGEPGEEINTLSKLFFDDYQFSKTLTPKIHMPKWDALSSHLLPCSDIIIVDRYLFSNEELFEFNIYYYLQVLGGNFINKKMNIVIFTCYEQKFTDSMGKSRTYTPGWKEIKKGLRDYLKEKYISAPNITLITLRKIEEHDRTIFTNYGYHYSGDSLNYYDSKWNLITKGRHYTLHSHGNRENLGNAILFIKDMQAVIDRLINLGNLGAFIGEKKSNFLSFPD